MRKRVKGPRKARAQRERYAMTLRLSADVHAYYAEVSALSEVRLSEVINVVIAMKLVTMSRGRHRARPMA